MKNRIVTAVFKDSAYTKSDNAWQWDYGQILRIQGLKLPTAVEVHFAVSGVSESITRIGTTKDGVTDVVIPDSLIETGKNLVAYVYLRDSESGNTEYQIDIVVSKRAKPEAYNTPDDPELFGKAIEAVNKAADRAEKAGQTAQEAAQKAGLDAEQTAQDRVEVAKMVETVTDISEQVKKVEELSNKAQESATQAGASAVAAEKAKAQAETAVGKTAEDRTAVNQVKIAVDEVQEAVRADRAAVEEAKQSVEQLSNAIPESTQVGVQAVNQAKQTAVDEIARTGISHKTAVEGAGTQAVENVENVKASATTAVEAAKTEAVQAVQTEGNTQTRNVTEEGAKQVKAVQDKGAEVLQSIPEDFTTQMDAKLNKQQGIENKGKVLVIGEDGNVVPEEVASGGGDGIAIINTMSGESPLVIPDSAERVNKRLELGGKTEQVQTSGKNLFDPNNNYEDLVWIRNDGEIVGGSNARTSDYIPVEQGNYAFQFDIPNPNQMFVAGYNADRAFVKIVGTISKGKGTVNIDDINIKTIRLSYTRDSTKIQLEFSANPTPYEPYTGGKPSPSPEYPQEIKNSGKWNEETQKYEVDVKITGKNLFNREKAKDESNWKHISGYQNYPIYVGTGNKVTFSYLEKLNTGLPLYFGVGFKESSISEYMYHATTSSLIANKKTLTATGDHAYLIVSESNVSAFLDAIQTFQVEISPTQTDYAPYKEQTLTLTSDRPITKWDRLVEQGGQIGWLYGGVVVDGFNGQSNKITIANKQGDVQNFSIQFDNVPDGNGNADIFIDKYRAVELSYTKAEYGICCNWNAGVKYFSAPNENVTTVDEFKAWLIENPLKIAYETTNSEFIPLPQSEQNAIRALKTYYPTTVITVDGGEVDPDIKATYTADTKNYIDGKVSANVASILRQYQADTVNLLSLMPMETQATMIENDTNNILGDMEVQTHE